MRRASEMPYVKTLTHIKIHGAGSGKKQDFDDTLNLGNTIYIGKQISSRRNSRERKKWNQLNSYLRRGKQ
ncbi:MAG: hypothetical protein GX969_06845 [Firmicutes bacterium]|nr:hypothetical protein [Bacillota bacterium]